MRDAKDAQAVHVVAASNLLEQNASRSIELLQQVPESMQSNALSNRLAGYAWIVRNDFQRAKSCLDTSIRIDPHQPDCWNLLGQLAEKNSEFDSAKGYYQRGILFDDKGHDSAISLSRLHARHRNLKQAIHTLRVCLLRDRRSPVLNLALAKLLDRRTRTLNRRRAKRLQRKLREESLQCYRIVNAVSPGSATWIAQGRVEQNLMDYSAARSSFQRAVDCAPQCPIAISKLACINVDFGDLEHAIELFEKALSIDPSRAETHFRYARANRFQPGPKSDAYIRRLEQQIDQLDPSMPVELLEQKQIYLRFALAKVLDETARQDPDRHGLAWQQFERANQLKPGHSQTISHRRRPAVAVTAPLDESVDQMIDVFDADFFRKRQSFGVPTRMPIFIVGMPRSGTTLTEQIISSHPQVAGAGELTFIDQLRNEIARNRNALNGNVRDKQQTSPEMLNVQYLQALSSQSHDEIASNASEYIRHLQSFRTDESRVTDKMPTNFMHLGLIALMFPQATIIHCRRDPMDVLVSCICQNLNPPFCDPDALVEYHRCYRRLMAHWRRVLPISIYDSDYESLVKDPESQSKAMIQHCQLDWSLDCLRYQSNRRAVHTPSKWQVRQPVYQTSIEKWRRFEKYLAPVAEQISKEIECESAASNRT